METADDPELVITRFRSRRNRQFILAGVVIAMVMIQILFGRSNQSTQLERFIAITLPAVVVGGLVFSLFNWRCPKCNGYLGRSLNPRYCSKCGAQLR